jgi:hypothetical protein
LLSLFESGGRGEAEAGVAAAEEVAAIVEGAEMLGVKVTNNTRLFCD